MAVFARCFKVTPNVAAKQQAADGEVGRGLPA